MLINETMTEINDAHEAQIRENRRLIDEAYAVQVREKRKRDDEAYKRRMKYWTGLFERISSPITWILAFTHIQRPCIEKENNEESSSEDRCSVVVSGSQLNATNSRSGLTHRQ